MFNIKKYIPFNGEEIWDKLQENKTPNGTTVKIAEFPDDDAEAYIYQASGLSLYLYAVFQEQVFLDGNAENADDISDFLLDLVNNLFPDLSTDEYSEIEDFLFGIEKTDVSEVLFGKEDVLDDRYYDRYYDRYDDYYDNYYNYYDKYKIHKEKTETVTKTPGFLNITMVKKRRKLKWV